MGITVKNRILTAITTTLITVFVLASTQSMAKGPVSANGKYHNLIQKLHCPSDQARYGKYRDYGYWGGGPWCGQQGQPGYWVWAYPFWYVYTDKGLPAAASAHGKYSNLLQTLTCPKDRRRYGKYSDYGYWGGGAWCGKQGKRGFWVWVAPTWYIWGTKN
jgi:hypothetical protein